MSELETKQFSTSAKWNIQYGVTGEESAPAILFFHGFPGSHQQAGLLTVHAHRHGFRLIAVDRPGYGQTTALPLGAYQEYIRGVAELMDHLRIDKFRVLGVSGGAPMSWLMASAFASRVQALGLVCGLATYNRETKPIFKSFKNIALGLRGLMPASALGFVLDHSVFQVSPEKLLKKLARFLSPEDKAVFIDPDVKALLLRSMKMARSQKSKGLLWDSYMYRQDWFAEGVDGSILESMPIHFWHGEQDQVLDVRMSEYMKSKFEHAKLTIYSGAGHYSLPVQKADDILREFL